MYQNKCVDFKLGYVAGLRTRTRWNSIVFAELELELEKCMIFWTQTWTRSFLPKSNLNLENKIFWTRTRKYLLNSVQNRSSSQPWYADAKSDAIAFCVKTYPSGSFIKNRTNMHEMQNRMIIAFCVKPPLTSFCLRIKGAPREVFGGPQLA